jgi:hypothetical protein
MTTPSSPETVSEFIKDLLDWFHCGAQILLRDFKRRLDEGIQQIVEDWKKCGEDLEPATNPDAAETMFLDDIVKAVETYGDDDDLRFRRMRDIYLAIRFVAISTNNLQHQYLPSLRSLSSQTEGLFATDESVASALRSVGIELEEWKGKLPGCDALPSSELDEIVEIFDVSADDAFAHVCDILEPLGWKNPCDTRSPKKKKKEANSKKQKPAFAEL